jgi:hypothetical protein
MSCNGVRFYLIQYSLPRGYEESDEARLSEVFEELSQRDSVSFLQGSLTPHNFAKKLISMRCLVLPYHPMSYDRRISGLLIEALGIGVDCIVPEGTWLEEFAGRFDNVLKFEYAQDPHKMILNLSDSMRIYLDESRYSKRNSLLTSSQVQSEFSAEAFVRTLIGN